jgi:hypothetical protein
MELNDDQLLEFRNRCLQAVQNNYTIGLADEYMTALAKEVGQDIVPEGVAKSSAAHLLGLAQEALDLRAGKKHRPKKSEPKKPEAKVETPKVEEPKVETPPPAPEPVKVEEPVVPEAKVEEKSAEAPKADDKKSGKSKK